MRGLVWFRRDLRIQDNTALSRAARHSDDGLVALYLVTPGQWKEHDDASAKVRFWLENLKQLAFQLAELQIPLRIETCETYQQVPQIVASVARTAIARRSTSIANMKSMNATGIATLNHMVNRSVWMCMPFTIA